MGVKETVRPGAKFGDLSSGDFFKFDRESPLCFGGAILNQYIVVGGSEPGGVWTHTGGPLTYVIRATDVEIVYNQP